MVSQHQFQNQNEQVQFLKTVTGGFGWSYTWDKSTKKSNWLEVSHLTEEVFEGNDLYFGVNPTFSPGGSSQRSRIEDISSLAVLFADFDAKDFVGKKELVREHINNISVEPSIIVDSGGGYHCYWLLEENFKIENEDARNRAKSIQKAWVKFVGADLRAADLARVLRIPGTFNKKYNPPSPVRLCKADYDLRYSLEYLESLVPQDEVKKANSRTFVIPEELPCLPIRINRRDNIEKEVKFLKRLHYAKRGREVTGMNSFNKEVKYKSRSEAEASVVAGLILKAFSFDEIHQLFEQYKPGHYYSLPKKDRYAYFAITYANVMTNIVNTPVRQQLAVIYHMVSQMPWNGRTGATDRSVLLAIVAKCYQFGSMIAQVSNREIREISSVQSITTVSNSVIRLEKANLIKVDRNVEGHKPYKYDITDIFDKLVTRMDISQYAAPSNDYCPFMSQNDETDYTEKIWSSKFLGSSAGLVYKHLTDELKDMSSLAQETGKHERTVRRALEKLVKYGLAKKIGKEYVIGNVPLKEIALELGCDQIAKEQRKKHHIEREIYHAACVRKAKSLAESQEDALDGTHEVESRPCLGVKTYSFDSNKFKIPTTANGFTVFAGIGSQ